MRTEALLSCFATWDMVLQCFGLYDSVQLEITQLPSFPYHNLELWNKMFWKGKTFSIKFCVRNHWKKYTIYANYVTWILKLWKMFFVPLTKFGFPPELQGPKFSNIYLFFPSIRMTFTCASVGCLACRELLDVVFLCLCWFLKFFILDRYSISCCQVFYWKSHIFFNYRFCHSASKQILCSSAICSSNFKFLGIIPRLMRSSSSPL